MKQNLALLDKNYYKYVIFGMTHVNLELFPGSKSFLIARKGKVVIKGVYRGRGWTKKNVLSSTDRTHPKRRNNGRSQPL